MKTALSWFLLLVLVGASMASWGSEQDATGTVGQFDQVLGGRVYRAMLLKSKRSRQFFLSLFITFSRLTNLPAAFQPASV